VLHVDSSLRPAPARLALIWAEGLSPLPESPVLPDWARLAVERARAAGDAAWPPGLKERVRAMLRFGRYRPAGRGKPASEFLLQAALANDFPNLPPSVLANNVVSLESGYPGSLFDAGRSGWELLLRRGRPGESYVFNASGQSIDLADLLLLCRRAGDAWVPCGNPVKDSQETKVSGSTREVLAVLFAPSDEDGERLAHFAGRFAALLREHCGATRAQSRLAP
jgi:DNA/RNA-binding domain of Phe-tRNA-synthetase-like protein